MFMPTSDRLTMSGGLLDSRAFSIEMNAMAFHSVINGIYADKIKAPIRELATNARDGHVAAGRGDQPFDIQLPSTLEPTFRIRDYGCSMTHDEVMGLYSTMFASSKRETNEQTGMIGLGSKSPFAYTSIFNVTCWKDGEERRYSCFIGSDEVPQTALISRVDSDEPEGMEVSFAVKIEDVNKFRVKAAEVLFGFDPKPNILNETFEWGQPEVLYSGDGWAFYNGTTVPFRKPMARQGSVLYPIDFNALGLMDDISNWPLLIDFPIGELSVATSREQLGYDERTRNNILARLDKIRVEAAKLTQADIDQCETYLDACELYEQRTAYHAPTRPLWQLAGSHLQWNGRKLLTRFKVEPHYDGGSIMRIDGLLTPLGTVKKSVAFRPAAFGQTYDISNIKRAVAYHERPSVKNGPSRMRRVLSEADGDTLVFWIRTKEEDLPEEIHQAIGYLDVVDLETVEPLTLSSKKKNNEDRRVLRVLNLDQPWNRWNTPTAVYEEVTINEDLLYVQQKGDTFYLGNQAMALPLLWEDLRAAIQIGALKEGTKVYLLNRSHEKFIKEGKGTPVEKVLTPALRKLLPTLNLSTDQYELGRIISQAKVLKEITEGMSIPDDIQKFIDLAIGEQNKVGETVSGHLRSVLRILLPDETAAAEKKASPLFGQKADLETKYPLLFYILPTYSVDNNSRNRIIHYMELLNK